MQMIDVVCAFIGLEKLKEIQDQYIIYMLSMHLFQLAFLITEKCDWTSKVINI